MSDAQKTKLRIKCYLYLFGPSACVAMYSMIQPGVTKQYNRCMGQDEQYFFNIPSFLDESMGGPMYKLPVWHPFRLVILFLFDIYLILVPYTYIKIFIFRISLRTNQKGDTSLKRRNIVSTGYNMAVWFVEALVTLMVSNFFQSYSL